MNGKILPDRQGGPVFMTLSLRVIMMNYENKRRAVRAFAALRGKPTNGRAAEYYDHSKRADWQQCPEDGIADLLTDIRHVCDALNLDFADLDSRAYTHYLEERHG